MALTPQTTTLNRRITYFNQLANSAFALEDQIEDMIEKGKILSAMLGINTWVDGFACTPTSPLSLGVNIGPGTIYENLNVDSTAFGSTPSQIAADTTHQVMKIGSNLANYSMNPINFVPPVTVGQSRNDLIEITINEIDGDNQSIPFWNGINGSTNLPNPPLFVNENVHRTCNVVIMVKPGTPATTGMQTTPTPDAGYIGAWVITTAQGQTTITTGNIVAYQQYAGDPLYGVSNPTAFLNEKLPQKLSKATADTLYVTNASIQAGLPIYSVDTGAANAYVATLAPALTAYTAGGPLLLKVANANTGASTLNVNALGAKSIKYTNGTALLPGALIAGMIAELDYDGTNYQLLNPVANNLNTVVYQSTPQAIGASGSFVLITFDTVSFDLNSSYNIGTSKFQPTVAGYYYIRAKISVLGVTLDQIDLEIQKNGTVVSIESQIPPFLSTVNLGTSCQVFLNGSTDFIQAFSTNVSSANVYNTQAGLGSTFLSAFRCG